MAHVLLVGDEARCASIRAQLNQWGLTVAGVADAAPGSSGVGVDACDVVIMVGSAARRGSDAASDGGRGAAPAAPRLFLSGDEAASELARELGPRIREACLVARGLRGLRSPGLPDHGESEPGEDVHQVGHELRSPLTAIKTALELMEGDLRRWHAEPADVGAQLKMLEIALRNVRRLHRAVEWSQMLLAGPRTEAALPDAGDVASVAGAVSHEPEAERHACRSGTG